MSIEHCWYTVFNFHSLTPVSFFSNSSQASLKKLLDYIQTGTIEKMAKVLDKGLDPNFHDPDSGGEFATTRYGNYISEKVYSLIL